MKTDNSPEFSVLIVCDDDKFREQLAQYLREEGFQIVEANNTSKGCTLIREGKASLVLTDWDLSMHCSSPEEPSTALEILRTCHEVNALLPVVVMTGAPPHSGA